MVRNAYLEAHSLQHDSRGTRSWEIYNNTIIQEDGSTGTPPIWMRGGTGVVFNNTVTGYWVTQGILLDNRRSFEDFHSVSGPCDGTSPWDGNEDSTGYPCRDQIGRSTDEWRWTSDNPYPPQKSDPAYCWNNTINNEQMIFLVRSSCSHHIQHERDYYNNVEKDGYTPYIYPHPYTFDEDIDDDVDGMDLASLKWCCRA